MFANCKSLSRLSNISKWNTNNVKEMSHMLSNVRNEISLVYIINKNKSKIRLFGEKFVKNNYGNYYLIIENKIINLCENYEYDTTKEGKNFNITLCEKYIMADLSYMFCDCKELLSIPIINELNTSEVKYMRYMFSN